MSDTSEFGSGVVVCLAKFSEHLMNRLACSVMNEIRYQQMTPSERTAETAEARAYPKGDAAQRIASRLYSGALGHLVRDPVSEALTVWANGASDHFYDLDRARAPAPLIALADLMLTMGHGFSGRRWTVADWDRIHALWQDSCVAVDQLLGITPDWGTW